MSQTRAQPDAPAGPPRQYRPADHESRIRQRWESSGAFHADPQRVLRGEARPYCILIPPPNVTDRLHLGHALNNTLQDILVRAHRMMGFETLWMPGTDHAGIATQAVVERRLRAEGKLKGPLRESMSREDFIAAVQSFKDEYEATITDQLRRMGCSCDWKRQRFTMDEICARAVREAFFRLFRDGLIYRGKRLVNWDPVLQTAVADDEVEDIEVDGHFYYLRYPLMHPWRDDDEPTPVTWSELFARGYPQPAAALEPATAGEYEDDKPAWLTVATTRPETYLGDTAVAVNPRDPRAPSLRDLCVELPLVGRAIPIIEDDYVVMPAAPRDDDDADDQAVDPKARYATGFLKVTPAHDPNDYEIWQRHQREMFHGAINILAPDATISDKHGWEDVRDAHLFVGKSREEARKLVLREFQARGLLENIRDYRHSVKHSDRSKAVIEPYLSDQWYVRVTDDRMRGWALDAMNPEQRTSSPGGGTGVSPVPFSSSPSSPPPGGTGVSPVPFSSSPSPPPPGGTGVSPVPRSPSLSKSRRYLPHWRREGSTYFVTWRTHHGNLTDEERQIVLDACCHWHDTRATIHLACVMPDHVHLLITPAPGHELSALLQSIKGFASHQILQRGEREAPIWLEESYDRIVRDYEEFIEKWNYTLENPVKEGLADRPWHYRFVRSPEQEARTGVIEMHEGAETGTGETPVPPAHLTFHPSRYAKTFESWHENIRDWCISRQLWWGHRIPVWLASPLIGLGIRPSFAPDGRHTATDMFLDPKLAAWTSELRVAWDFDRDAPRQNQPVFVCVHDVNDVEIIEYLEERGCVRDPDVLDTWFSSALWPLSTLGWPQPPDDMKGLLEAFNPTSTLCTAREIITLWVSRMVMFNRYFQREGDNTPGPIPFHDVFIHALIMDGDGRKMSKSLGNGVDPLDIIATHGADAMRFTLCHMTTQTQDVRMPVVRDEATGRNTSPKFDFGRNFCNKLWNAANFALSILEGGRDASPTGNESMAPIDRAALSLPDRWMLSRLAAGVDRAETALKRYEFADYAEAVYDLLWRDFCDWYIEAIKPTVAGDPAQQAVLAHTLETILRLLHPVCPFITEAIWERVCNISTAPIDGIDLSPARVNGLLCTAGWPRVSTSLRDKPAEQAFSRMQGLISAIREVRAQHQVPPKRRVKLHAPVEWARELVRYEGLVEFLSGLSGGSTSPPEGPSAAFTFDSAEFRLSELADAVDAGAERARLTKARDDLSKSIATLEGRLANPGYSQRAPAHLVEQTRQQLANLQAELATTTAALEALP